MKFLSTDSNQQRTRLLGALANQPVTTLQELREQGYNIQTHRRTVETDKGKHAAVAEYVLLSGGV